jgi:tetratricopeptide (TPR) repeat protein
MQRPAGTRHTRKHHIFSHYSRIVIIAVLLAGLVCLPALGAPITAGISTESSGNSQLSAAAYVYQGMSLMAHQNWNALITTTSEGLALYPDDAELWCLKGYALRKTGYYAEAVDNVTRGIALDPKPVRYANRGFALLALGRYDDALDDANTAISINQSYTPAYGVKAIALFNKGNLTGAGQAIETGIVLDPNNPFFWQVKGKILAAQGNCTGAAGAFRNSIQVNPDYDLPWPGFANATTDLQDTETQCAAVPASTPAPTRAAFPAMLVATALALAILSREW